MDLATIAKNLPGGVFGFAAGLWSWNSWAAACPNAIGPGWDGYGCLALFGDPGGWARIGPITIGAWMGLVTVLGVAANIVFINRHSIAAAFKGMTSRT